MRASSTVHPDPPSIRVVQLPASLSLLLADALPSASDHLVPRQPAHTLARPDIYIHIASHTHLQLAIESPMYSHLAHSIPVDFSLRICTPTVSNRQTLTSPDANADSDGERLRMRRLRTHTATTMDASSTEPEPESWINE
ncbi:hypothetical protein B0H14DRAFT_3890421 [Mycena olivaceomarginata]|nr:hypothetical protein B0H14DRAFT_3890421 [Mycena olivaceomarginata]